MYDLKKANAKLFWLKTLFLIFALGAPVSLLAIRYELVTDFTGQKISGIVFFIVLIALWVFRGQVMDWVNKRTRFSTFRSILYGLSKIWIFPIIWILALIIKKEAEELMFIVQWLTVFEVIAFLGIQPFIEYITKKIEREERKKEMREAISESGGVSIR
jgi:hypothetical protein